MQTLTAIDLVDPAQACEKLGLNEQGLLALVNQGSLPAYNIAGHIRFRMTDILP